MTAGDAGGGHDRIENCQIGHRDKLEHLFRNAPRRPWQRKRLAADAARKVRRLLIVLPTLFPRHGTLPSGFPTAAGADLLGRSNLAVASVAVPATIPVRPYDAIRDAA